MSREEVIFSYRFRVRYAEVDPQAVVFNSRYLEYADMLLNEFWRSRGITIAGSDAFEVHVRKATVDFLKPILLDEEIDGCIRESHIGGASIVTFIEFHAADRDDLRATCELVHVHVDLKTGLSAPIPDAVRLAFSD